MSRRILAVDDEADIGIVIRHTLSRLPDTELRVCSSGAEALATEGLDRVDLFLLDVMMPGMDGPQLMSELEAVLGRRPRVAFLTARASPRDREQLLALGALAVLVKPFDPAALIRQVGALLD